MYSIAVMVIVVSQHTDRTAHQQLFLFLLLLLIKVSDSVRNAVAKAPAHSLTTGSHVKTEILQYCCN